MVTAFVLINVQDKDLGKIAGNLLAMPGVKEAHVVAGEYDIVAVVRVQDNHALSELITQQIVHAPGILRTKTLFAIQSHSPYDLQKLFGV